MVLEREGWENVGKAAMETTETGANEISGGMLNGR